MLNNLLLTLLLTTSIPSVDGVTKSAKDAVQIDCIARAIYFEARGSSLEGQATVGQVVRERVHNDKFPNTYCSVVYQPNQFSWTKNKKLKITNEKAWNKAKKLAEITYYQGWPEDLTHGALYFHSGKDPYWAKSFDKTKKIDGHKFYKPKT
ncbi:endolysin [Pectobacterium phage My1]|uniref:Putative cell wall hydrolase n=1 Tax=Pectobacterium phage My1 TaxID=1204539 RepID=J9QM71_9CAUD|nr:endolysin [Pectobacterium phage My1]AFQ22238.1 putative cell wall hydrolase [Pectobacterium phage My1]